MVCDDCDLISARRPNFIFIGPDKSGSTWLYKALREHKDVYLPRVKELFFFDRFYPRGWQWYATYFAEAPKDCRIIGELSHDYLFSELACKRIARDIPFVKLMVCLREPVQRAFSAYLYMVKQGRVRSDFDVAIKEIDELIDHGCYAKHLERYLDAFDRERIHVAVFDDLVESPQLFFDRICGFLGVEVMELPAKLRENVLPAARPRSTFAAALAKNIGRVVRYIGMPGVVAAIKDSEIVNRALYVAYNSENKPVISQSTEHYLRELFLPEIQRVDDLLGFDLCGRWGYRGS
jgi:hypothetical protein